MLRARRASAPTDDPNYVPTLEQLEPRLAMTASLSACDNLPLTLSHGGACACPICTGQGLENLVAADIAQATTTDGGTLSPASPLSALPQLASNSAARVKIYLDFNGNFESAWGSYRNVTTRVFDQDADATTFSTTEISTIREIWTRVAEDYAPFNVDVTTIDPGSFANGAAVRMAIGGNYSDWFGQTAGGVAYVGGFTNSASNTGFIFEDALGNGSARYVAEAVSHEAGHLFGLLHQSVWVNGQLQDEYNAGNSAWAPIMGVGYYSTRTTWHNGTSDDGAAAYQDDVAFLAGSTNGFGLRADDFSSNYVTPSNLPVNGSSVNFAGLIGSRNDLDIFQFSTSGGIASFQLSVAQFGNNLDGAIEIRAANGGVITASDPAGSFGGSVSANLSAGSYFLVVRASGTIGNAAYGNLGQYTVTGSLPTGTPVAAPEVSVLVGNTEIADGGTIDFGSTSAGTAVTRIVTVKNVGNADLSVNAITSAIPAGFTLVSNFSSGTIAAGQSVTFTLRLNAATSGSFAGDIAFQNGDANEGTYNLHLQGSVTSGSTSGTATYGPNIRTIDDGAAGNTLTGTWRLGTRGREGDVRVASPASTDTAVSRWSFTNLAPGQYRVYMSWSGDRYNASNTPVTLVTGGVNRGTTYHSQRIASSGYTADGTSWVKVRELTINASTLTVVLSNKANGNVVADAVRIERVAAASSLSRGASPNEEGDLAPASGVFVASAPVSSHSNSVDTVRSESGRHFADVPAHEQFARDLDVAPELSLLEETLDLVRDVQRATRSADAGSDGGLATLFGQETDWLAIL